MIRIKDIAKRAGVSPTTVSNVIHGNYGKVSKKTVERVEKLLAETEYVPSMGAMMLAGGNSRIIGVLVGEPEGEKHGREGYAFSNVLIRAIESEIYKKNYYMLLHFTPDPEEGIQFAATWNVEGLITIGLHAKSNALLQVKGKAPVVSIDTYYEKQDIANVGLDDFGGGYLMTEYLLDCGHRKIGFVADNNVGVDHERWKGVCLAYENRMGNTEGIRHIIIPGEWKEREAFYEKYLLRLAKAEDALFFASDYYAAEAVVRLRDLGIYVPEGISVAGFDDSEAAKLCRPKLTTIHQDIAEKGGHAVKKLFQLIDGEPNVSMSDQLPISLIVRDSVKNMQNV